MDTIKAYFCKSLQEWKSSYWAGTVKELAKYFGVQSQGHMSNILAGRKCPDETWRRMVAKKIGIPYDEMIGMTTQSMGMDIAVVAASDITTERHRQTIDEFQDKKLALEINKELVELEKLDKSQLEKILEIIQDRKFRLEQEAIKKRPAANEKD